MSNPILLVSDLDGTLLGDDLALDRFEKWLRPHRRQVLLAYATGQTAQAVRQLLGKDLLPEPDFVIGAVGTEIVDCQSYANLTDWVMAERGDWNVATILRVARDFPGLKLQTEEFQSPSKVSFFATGVVSEQLAQFGIALRMAGILATQTYSCQRFLDLTPYGVNKGTAARHLSRRLAIPRQRVVACGDSGNDLPLFCEGFCGVLVANSHPELTRCVVGPVYRSPFPHADGVIDGVEYWRRQCPLP